MLQIVNFKTFVGDKQILNGVNLDVKAGEVHVLCGPNGCGKSTLAQSLAGYPNYTVSPDSQILLDGQDCAPLSPDKRVKMGLFLAFQDPIDIPGVKVMDLLKKSYDTLYPEAKLPLFKFRDLVKGFASDLNLKFELLQREMSGFSGGEKKRLEILQMRLLKPKYVILDEIDSGLDVDALKRVGSVIQKTVEEEGLACLIITHHQRILQYIQATTVSVMLKGKIVKTGDKSLLELIDKEGYKQFENE